MGQNGNDGYNGQFLRTNRVFLLTMTNMHVKGVGK